MVPVCALSGGYGSFMLCAIALVIAGRCADLCIVARFFTCCKCIVVASIAVVLYRDVCLTFFAEFGFNVFVFAGELPFCAYSGDVACDDVDFKWQSAMAMVPVANDGV